MLFTFVTIFILLTQLACISTYHVNVEFITKMVSCYSDMFSYET